MKVCITVWQLLDRVNSLSLPVRVFELPVSQYNHRTVHVLSVCVVCCAVREGDPVIGTKSHDVRHGETN